MTNWEKFKEVFGIDMDSNLEMDLDICNILDCTDLQCANCPIQKLGMDYPSFWDDKYKYEHDKMQVLDKIRAKMIRRRWTLSNAISKDDESKIWGMKEAYTDCIGMIDEYISEMENDND